MDQWIMDLFTIKYFIKQTNKKYETFFWDSFDFWQRKFMFEIAQFWQEVSKRLGSIFEQWTKLHFKLNLERTLMHEPLVCKWTERISLSLCTWSQMVKSLLPIFLLSYITYSFLWYMYNFWNLKKIVSNRPTF